MTEPVVLDVGVQPFTLMTYCPGRVDKGIWKLPCNTSEAEAVLTLVVRVPAVVSVVVVAEGD